MRDFLYYLCTPESETEFDPRVVAAFEKGFRQGKLEMARAVDSGLSTGRLFLIGPLRNPE